MLKPIIIYGISTGINRGIFLIYLPILLSILTISDYGLYSLALVLSQLILPIISLNGSAAIMREGADDSNKGYNLLIKYLFITIALTVCFGSFFFFIAYKTTFFWIVFSILIAGVEAKHLLLLTQLRCLNYLWSYLFFILVKVIGFLIILILLPHPYKNLESILLIQFIWFLFILVIGLLVFMLLNKDIKYNNVKVTLTAVIPYSMLLIPHGISQWIISSSDRFIIKRLLGDADVGIYSIAYSIAMILMLVNSGIALSLPQHLIRNYDNWTKGDLRKKFILFYNLICISLFFFVNLLLLLDKRHIGILSHHEEIGVTIIFIWASLHLLGLYLLYSNFFYYHKKTGMLATQTLIAALINILITFIMVKMVGFNGAAIGTFISYAIYLLFVIRAVTKIEDELKGKILKDLWYTPLVTIIIFIVGYYQLIVVL